ncbi:MAG: HAD family phosphatase [Eubacterium sp.]|nr:HAD family phosphatase [Eubacterium sp.]
MKQYKNVVFDVGDVLVDFRYRDLMRDLGFDEETVEFLSKNMVETEFWHELDLGLWNQEDAVNKYTVEFPEYREQVLAFWDNIQDVVREYDYAPGLIKGIKDQGYGVYILSNYPVDTAEMHWPTFKFLPLTDGHIISGYEKITKPDEAIYRLLESRFGIKLEESIFIDDRQVNIDAASEFGMKAILFKGYDALLEELAELGIGLN